MSICIRLSVISTLLLAGLALGAAPSTAEAQFGKRLKDAVKRTAEDKAIQKATDKESKAIDDAVEGGGEASGAAEETAAAPAEPDAATGTAAASEAAPGTGTATATEKPKNAGEGAFVNFDFVPGERVIFYDDYAGDNVGDFPRRLEFAEGNADVAEWEGAKWLRVVKSSKFAIPLPETLPERFTIEFDFVTNHTASNGWPIMLNASGSDVNWESQGNTYPTVRFSYREGGVYVGKIESESPVGDLQNKVTRARIMVDGK